MKKYLLMMTLFTHLLSFGQIIDPNYVVSNVTCAGYGNASITGIAATYLGFPAPIVWQWGNSVTGLNYFQGSQFNSLSPGTYSLIATDTNFNPPISETQVITITEPSIVNLNHTITANTCTNVAGIMMGSGGTPPLTYSIDGINYSTNTSFNFTQLFMPGHLTFYLKDVNSCYVSNGFVHGELGYPPANTGTKVDVSTFGANDGQLLNIPSIDAAKKTPKFLVILFKIGQVAF
jgi:hypothetical protein